MSPRQIKTKYQKRAMAILNRIAGTLRLAGFNCEGPWDISVDYYRWELVVKSENLNVDISLQICESEQYDGEVGGVNFTLDIVEYGGRIIGGLSPFNYTDRCWVSRKDKQAIEERFCMLEQLDGYGIVELLKAETHSIN
jgi:hypothetical protein